jgi:RNA polymerase sigma-70 factor (ECF subfamily)
VPISLELQNRSKWDRRLIEEGNFYLNTISHDQINEYFLQAAIISIHTNSRTYKDTSWSSICALYQRLYNMKPNAMVGLNHVIALQKSAGATIAKSHLNSLAKLYNYKKTPLYHAVLSELEIDLDNLNLAQVHLSTAISLTKSESEKLFFTKKLAQLFDGNASSKS